MSECKPNCDFENPVMRGRATWLCAKCGRDFSLEYLLWHQTAHPEDWYEKPVQLNQQTNEQPNSTTAVTPCGTCGDVSNDGDTTRSN